MFGDYFTANAVVYDSTGKGMYVVSKVAPPQTVIAQDGEYKGQKVEINKPLPLKIPFCTPFGRKGETRLSCMNAVIYDASGKGRLTIYKAFGEHVFKQEEVTLPVIKLVAERVPLAVAEAEKKAELMAKSEVGAMGPEVIQAGIFGGGNAMLIALGLGFIAIIGGIMFFAKKKKGKKGIKEVAYAK